MTRNDDGHKVARIIKGLEERIANLEEKDRSATIPTLLRTKTDRVTISDSTPTVTESPLQTARWNDSLETSGYSEGGYNEGGYSGWTNTNDTGDESTDTTAGFGDGGYGDGVYGTGSSSGSGAERATTGWHTGLWGMYRRQGPQPNGPGGAWTLIIQDEFDAGSLDTTLWGINAGETEDALDDDANTDPELVSVGNDTCTLAVESDGSGVDGCYQGPISTYPGDQSYHADEGFATGNDPGVYIETRAQLAGPRNGLLPAFWLNPVGSNTWPPEIDIYELFQETDDPDTTLTDHSGHWTTSEEPGDSANHLGLGYEHDHGVDTTAGMHTYGSAWFQDRIEFYIDGEHVATLDLLPMLRTMNDADRNDMYLKYTTHVNRVGSADLQSAWTEKSIIDYVRVWEFDGTAPDPPSPPSFTTVDNFDGGVIDSGWDDPQDAWTTSDTYSISGSHSLTNTANHERIGWEGAASFSAGETGTRLEYDFCFGDDSSNRLNARFGATGAADTESYRLDVLDSGDVYLFETTDWTTLYHDQDFTAGSAGEFYTAEIEWTTNNIRYEIRDEAGSVASTHAIYHTEPYRGDVFSFNCEEGTAYIDEVRVAATGLVVGSGDTYTIPSGETESYTAASVEGVLEADGVLETE